jgi:hypothetical protein
MSWDMTFGKGWTTVRHAASPQAQLSIVAALRAWMSKKLNDPLLAATGNNFELEPQHRHKATLIGPRNNIDWLLYKLCMAREFKRVQLLAVGAVIIAPYISRRSCINTKSSLS